ncbi:MAG: WYL domain-containing protein, partial [Helicobacter sp.]|uniref:WYL domain-containing protein n=1 Tax=Helicobacter sp. TaxID=218 RepID=UPI0023C4FD6B
PPPINRPIKKTTRDCASKISIKNHHIESSVKLDDVFYRLKNASFYYCPTKFIYKDKLREVNPYLLVHNDGVWYLLGDEKGVLKHFTLSKITCLQILETQKFTPNQEILATISQSYTTWISQNPILVRLKINNEAREYLFRKNFLIQYRILEQTPSYFVVECSFGYAQEALNLVKLFLPFVRILSPQSLQEKLENELKEYLEFCKQELLRK